jgi:hypothetical protein
MSAPGLLFIKKFWTFGTLLLPMVSVMPEKDCEEPGHPRGPQ